MVSVSRPFEFLQLSNCRFTHDVPDVPQIFVAAKALNIIYHATDHFLDADSDSEGNVSEAGSEVDDAPRVDVSREYVNIFMTPELQSLQVNLGRQAVTLLRELLERPDVLRNVRRIQIGGDTKAGTVNDTSSSLIALCTSLEKGWFSSKRYVSGGGFTTMVPAAVTATSLKPPPDTLVFFSGTRQMLRSVCLSTTIHELEVDAYCYLSRPDTAETIAKTLEQYPTLLNGVKYLSFSVKQITEDVLEVLGTMCPQLQILQIFIVPELPGVINAMCGSSMMLARVRAMSSCHNSDSQPTHSTGIRESSRKQSRRLARRVQICRSKAVHPSRMRRKRSVLD
jgi:hypothetical protein